MRILDRYMLADFWRNLAIGLAAFMVIYVTVDINERIDDYIDFRAHFSTVALYYIYKIPWILTLVMPVAILLATIFSLGRLSRLNELTAFICSGTPFIRVAAPIIASSLALSIAVMLYGEFLLPATNRRADRLMEVKIKGTKETRDSRYRDNIHYQGESGRTYYAERYDAVLKALVNVTMHEHDGTKLTRRIDAKRAYWDGAQWIFIDGATRSFTENGEKISTFQKLELRNLPERPEDFLREEIAPEDMNARELNRYIDRLKRSGGPVDKYLVDLHFKFSFPFTNLIFAVLGASLASAKRKPSMATGFGLTLLVSFTYYGILRIGQALGHSGTMPPLPSAWIGNLLFMLVGGFLLYRANQ